MAKHSTIQKIKFKRLVRDIGECEAHALGHLEMMWNHAHVNGTPVFDTLDDVELAAGWAGEPGTLADALLKSRWLDQRKDGKYECHDYLDHAPHYVIERMRARQKRRTSPGHIPDKLPNVANKLPNVVSLTDTDTDTDTDTSTYTNTKRSIADSDSASTKTRARGGQPSSLADISPSAISQFTEENTEWWRRVSALVESHALAWWGETMRQYHEAGGDAAELDALITHYEDAGNAAIREAKGIGAFKSRNGMQRSMMKDMTRLLKEVGVTHWARYPSE